MVEEEVLNRNIRLVSHLNLELRMVVVQMYAITVPRIV